MWRIDIIYVPDVQATRVGKRDVGIWILLIQRYKRNQCVSIFFPLQPLSSCPAHKADLVPLSQFSDSRESCHSFHPHSFLNMYGLKLALAGLFAGTAYAASAEQWRGRSIYQYVSLNLSSLLILILHHQSYDRSFRPSSRL